MNAITKKRTKAYFIDLAVSTIVTAGVELLLRRKVKSEFVHAVITPTAVMWSLEYIQLRQSGQTIGNRVMGLSLENGDGTELTCNQILKRMAYRDTKSTFDYLKDRKGFEGDDGSVLPHDGFANTIVKEIGKPKENGCNN
ncbi:RDD family protein [Jeotgalibacillus sp. S-D1]|uniref:RDD family protein n=1 Tax=Jeotgalibacillus sp. S-D1 TaxID=2552189 RepID=UPI00105A8F9D|nr:RDD family protein [Jeotgalibacillus sp. S-D1]TDL30827.1 RDD family protein [Jeotgalibacillus sp. S-D1]